MQKTAVRLLLDMLPEELGVFEGADFPLPVKSTFLGDSDLSLPALRRELERAQTGDVKDLLDPLLLAAEQVEASQPDKQQYFLTDRTVQGMVFSGAKWRAGWALVLGGAGQAALVDELKRRSFMVFTDLPGVPDTQYIGPRDTSPIYFLQLMVRYGLTWGRIAPGDDHEMGHFLERDMPGLVFITEDLPPLKYLVALGLMKLGAPAVVPSSFPFPYGNRVVADTVPEMLDRGGRFENLRRRYFEDEVIQLPEPCNAAFANEVFTPAVRLGGSDLSFFCVRPAGAGEEKVPAVVGSPAKEVGILVEVRAEGLDADVVAMVERAALRAVNYLPGVHGYERAGVFHLDLADPAGPDSDLIRDTIYWGIRLQYPRLKDITVTVLYDHAALEQMAPVVREYRERRRASIDAMTDDNTEEFVACIECRPFSLVHTCIITPERIPMCASRTYASAKAAARFGTDVVPWKRPTERSLPTRKVFAKGRLLDAVKGEYEGVNRVYAEMTRESLQRVYLHSLRDFPHTSCGCFQALAFWIEPVQGIGIMLRNSEAVTPTGETWATLANRAGGKQSPGIMGVSLSYLRSPRFLSGDGGIANVVWVDSELRKRVSGLFGSDQRVATENEVTTIEELRRFLGR